MLKRTYVILAITALILGTGASFALAGDWSGEGEVVELGCYKSNGSSGAGHIACAKKCLSEGKPMGLLDADGNLVTLVAGDDEAAYKALINLAGKQVKVSGTESEGVVTVDTAEAAG